MDDDINKTINELEAFANKGRHVPKTLADLSPCERVLGDNIARTATALCLSDDETVAALVRVHAYLVYTIERLKGSTNDKG